MTDKTNKTANLESREKTTVFGPVRGHIATIFNGTLRNAGVFGVGALIAFLLGKNLDLKNAIPILIIAAVVILEKVFNFLFTFYEISDENLIYTQGLFNKKVRHIPLATISTVDITQPFICRLLGAYIINMDNYSSIAANSKEIPLVLNRKNADLFKSIVIKEQVKKADGYVDTDESVDSKHSSEQIKKSRSDGADRTLIYSCSFFDLCKQGLLKSRLLLMFQGLLLAFPIINQLEEWNLVSKQDWNNTKDFVAGRIDSQLLVDNILLLLAIFIFFGLIGVVMSLVKYFDFKVEKRVDMLHISYGLFTKKHFTIAKSKIAGFQWESNRMMELFGYCTVKVSAVGYGIGDDENSKEEAVLCPILPIKELTLIDNFIDEFSMEEVKGTEAFIPVKHSLKYFLIRPLPLFWYCTAAAAICMIIFLKLNPYIYLLVGAAILLGTALAVLNKKHNLCKVKDNFVLISTGSFKRCTMIIKMSKLESVKRSASVFKAKKGCYNIELGYIAAAAAPFETKCYNMPGRVYDEIRARLIF